MRPGGGWRGGWWEDNDDVSDNGRSRLERAGSKAEVKQALVAAVGGDAAQQRGTARERSNAQAHGKMGADD